MTITADPGELSNFHIKLTDSAPYSMGLIAAKLSGGKIVRDLELLSRTPVDRTAIKTSQGDTEYSDWRPPYYALKQDDWSGGRGQDEYNKDRTRFFDSIGINTRRPGQLHLNGQEQFSGLLRAGGGVYPTSASFTANPTNSATERCTKVLVSASTDYNQVWFRHPSTSAVSGVKLYDADDAAFATLLQTCPDSIPPAIAGGWHVINLTSAVTLVANHGVWVSIPNVEGAIGLYSSSADLGDHLAYYLIGVTPVETTGFDCRLLVKAEPEFGRLFEYKQALYYIQKVGTAVKLWLNGYRGVCSAGATTTATTDLTLTVNELAGAIFKVVGGTGINETRRWREIASNTAGASSVVTFTDGFTAALASGTEFVILGTDVWTEVTGHGLTNITDVLVAKRAVVYFCQGSTAAMRRMQEVNSAGTWTRTFAADSTNQANFLVEVGTTIWRVQNTTGEADGAASQDWGSDLTFNSPANIQCGDETSAFTGLEEYVDESGAASPFVMKEEITGYIETYAGVSTFIPLKIKEMKSLRSEKNGRAHLVHDTYLYFSLGNGLEQYFSPTVNDIGPNRDEGLPENRKGPIVTMEAYPGRPFLGIDAGSTGYSSVFSRSGGGYHEEFTGPYGQRMLSIISQPIPGDDNLDRLWVAYGGDVNWIPLPFENPLTDSSFLFTDSGYMESSAYYTDLKTALKFIASLKMAVKEINNIELLHDIQVEYKLDEGSWTSLDNTITPAADGSTWKYTTTTYVGGTAYYGLECHSIKVRIWLYTWDNTTSPVILAFVMEGLARIENKYAYTIPFVLEGTATDPAKDLQGTNDDIPAGLTKLNKLIDWADGGPLLMESMDSRFDNKMVFLLPFAENMANRIELDGRVYYVGQLTLQDA